MTTAPHPFDALIVNGDTVKRDKRDSPMIFAADHTGDLDFTQGKTVANRRGYSRVTSYIGVLDDQTNLDKYHQRNVVAGMVADPTLLVDAAESVKLGDTLDDPIVKDSLSGIARRAREAMYENRKADMGTAIHAWCEAADLAIHGGATPAAALAGLDRTQHVDGHRFNLTDHLDDVAAYLRATLPNLRPVAVETLIIVDDLKLAGSPDRLVEWIGPDIAPPHGPPITAGDILVDDTKTGGIEYALGKIAMQLGIYANGCFYDQVTNTRRPLPDRLRRDWAIIVHVPAGQGTASLVWVDIAAGWDAVVNLAGPVRRWRNASKKLSAPFPDLTDLDRVAAALDLDELRALWSDDWDGNVKAACLARVATFQAAEQAAA